MIVLTQEMMGCHSEAELQGFAHFGACCRGSWGQGSLEILLPRLLSMGYSPSHPGDQKYIKIISLLQPLDQFHMDYLKRGFTFKATKWYQIYPTNYFSLCCFGCSSLRHPGCSTSASHNDFLNFPKWLGNAHWMHYRDIEGTLTAITIAHCKIRLTDLLSTGL